MFCNCEADFPAERKASWRLLPAVLVLCLWWGAQIALAQFRPMELARGGSSRRPTFSSFRFQQLQFGHEGPDYFPLQGAPSKRCRQVAEARLYDIDGMATVQFKLLDENGNEIAILPAMRVDHSAEDAEFLVQVEVPDRPFGVVVSGHDLAGNAYRVKLAQLFRPQDQPPSPPLVPPGLPPEAAGQLKQILDSYAAEEQARWQKQMGEHPDGVITIAHAQVLQPQYDVLLSARGNAIGVRIQYSVLFSEDGTYAAFPTVFPVYADPQQRGAIEMRILETRVEPLPLAPRAELLPEILEWGGSAEYKANVKYQFTLDMAPNYVVRNAAKTRFCLYEQQMGVLPAQVAAWERIKASLEPVTYHVSWTGLGFEGKTGAMPPQRVLYESFVKEGANSCGPFPNRNF